MSERRFAGLSGVLAGSAAAITAVGGLIAILVQLGVIGANGDNTDTNKTFTGSSGDRPPKEHWAMQANKICEKANEDIDALPEPEALDPTALAGTAGEAVDIGQRQLRELQALAPPDEDAAKVRRLLRTYALSNEATEELVGALRVGDIAAIQPRIDALKRLGRSSDELANELGATTCAEGASFAETDLGGA